MEVANASAAKRRKKVGLAMSGGSARGLAHIGVLEVLQEEGIPIDMIAGTSAGGVIGAIYACNQDMSLIKKQAMAAKLKNLALIDPCLPLTGLIKGKKIQELITSYLGGSKKFSDLKIPFTCVTTDIATGEEVVLDHGSVPEALRASISIPGIFNVVKREGHYLVDGGLTTPLPVNVARQMGADLVIAVNVTPEISGRSWKKGREPNIFQVLMQSIYVATYSMAKSALVDADVAIEPDLMNLGAGDFQKAREFILRGEQAARQAIPQIREKLKSLK